MKKLCSISLALMATMYLASTVLASPIPLYTDQVSKLKYTNFEKLIDNQTDPNAGAGYISPGDQFEGILNVTNVYDVNTDSGSGLWNSGDNNVELTGDFKLTVASVTTGPNDTGSDVFLDPGIAPTSPVYITFTMDSSDYIRMYSDSSMDFDPTDAGSATNGNLWLEITGNDYVNGINQTTALNSTNYNWANLTQNNTGYTLTKEIWPFAANITFPYNYFTQIYFEDKITLLSSTLKDGTPNPAYVAGYRYRSEDPLYLNAVPEPATMTLFGLGLLFGGASIKRRRNSMK
jgi:hypothetical protein